MNARSTNRPGGRGRRPRVKSSGGGKKSGWSCVLILVALASVPAAAWAALDVVWG